MNSGANYLSSESFSTNSIELESSNIHMTGLIKSSLRALNTLLPTQKVMKLTNLLRQKIKEITSEVSENVTQSHTQNCVAWAKTLSFHSDV